MLLQGRGRSEPRPVHDITCIALLVLPVSYPFRGEAINTAFRVRSSARTAVAIEKVLYPDGENYRLSPRRVRVSLFSG